MANPDKDRILEVLDDQQERLAAFASASYRSVGRGVLSVEVPASPTPGGIFVGVTNMVYHTLEEIRDLMADLQGDSRADADIMICTIETYDPDGQAVVMAALAQGNPITIKMRLERPFIFDAPDSGALK